MEQRSVVSDAGQARILEVIPLDFAIAKRKFSVWVTSLLPVELIGSPRAAASSPIRKQGTPCTAIQGPTRDVHKPQPRPGKVRSERAMGSCVVFRAVERSSESRKGTYAGQSEEPP